MPSITVFLTVYNRINRLAQTLDELSRQTYSDFHTVVINNNILRRQEVDLIVARSALTNVCIAQQEFNTGTVGRYLMARNSSCDYAVFLDDDMTVNPEMMADFNAEKEPQALKSILGINFTDDFNSKKKAYPKFPAKVLGPGAMIADASLFRQDSFWSEWRPEFYVIDDLWISYYASTRGWKLEVISAKVFMNRSEDTAMLKNPIIQDLKLKFTQTHTW